MHICIVPFVFDSKINAPMPQLSVRSSQHFQFNKWETKYYQLTNMYVDYDP